MKIESGIYEVRVKFTHSGNEIEVNYHRLIVTCYESLKAELRNLEERAKDLYNDAREFGFVFKRVGDCKIGWLGI